MVIDTGYRVPKKPDTLNTHRIIADSANRLWIFFQTAYHSLAYGTSDDGGETWSPDREILSDISGPFAVASGSEDFVYVTARRSHPPDVLLLVWNGREWLNQVLLPAAEKQAVTSPPLLIVDNNGHVHLLYAIRHYSSAEWVTIHSIFHPEKQDLSVRTVSPVGAPPPVWSQRLSFIKEILYWSGDLVCDPYNNLHLVCRAYSGEYYQIHYNYFHNSTGEWHGFLPLTTTPFHRGHPRIISGPDNNIHVAFQREEESGSSIVCLTHHSRGRWVPEKVLGGCMQRDIPLELSNTDLGPVLYWVDSAGVNRNFLEFNRSTEKIIANEISSLSSTFAFNKVFLVWSGSHDKNKIYINTDNLSR